MSDEQRPTQQWMIKVNGVEEVRLDRGERIEIGRRPLRPLADDGLRRLDVPDKTKSMSKRHAIFTFAQDGSATLRDVGSTNGTYVVQEGEGLIRLPAQSDFLLPRSSVRFQFGDVPVDFIKIEVEAPEGSGDQPARQVPDLFSYADGAAAPVEPDASGMSVDDILDMRAGEPTGIFRAEGVRNQIGNPQTAGSADAPASAPTMGGAVTPGPGLQQVPAASQPSSAGTSPFADVPVAQSSVIPQGPAVAQGPVVTQDSSATQGPSAAQGPASVQGTAPVQGREGLQGRDGSQGRAVSPIPATDQDSPAYQGSSPSPAPISAQGPTAVPQEQGQPGPVTFVNPLASPGQGETSYPGQGPVSGQGPAGGVTGPGGTPDGQPQAQANPVQVRNLFADALGGEEPTASPLQAVSPAPTASQAPGVSSVPGVSSAPVVSSATTASHEPAASSPLPGLSAAPAAASPAPAFKSLGAVELDKQLKDREELARQGRQASQEQGRQAAYKPAFEPGSVFDRVSRGEFEAHSDAIEVEGLSSDDAKKTSDFSLQFEMARHRPLLPFLAMNPSLYDDLYAWLAAQGDQDIDAALDKNQGYQEYLEAMRK